MSSTPSWYRIPEIPFRDYVDTLTMIYDVFEENTKQTTDEDIFLKTIMTNRFNVQTQWHDLLQHRKFEKRLTMRLGKLHETLSGKITGYEKCPPRHARKCDVRKNDDSEYFELKNKYNTMNSESSKQVHLKLRQLMDSGKQAFLVLINCRQGRKVPRFSFHSGIHVINGKQFYQRLSGRETFYNDLLRTLAYTFQHYKIYSDLIELL